MSGGLNESDHGGGMRTPPDSPLLLLRFLHKVQHLSGVHRDVSSFLRPVGQLNLKTTLEREVKQVNTDQTRNYPGWI